MRERQRAKVVGIKLRGDLALVQLGSQHRRCVQGAEWALPSESRHLVRRLLVSIGVDSQLATQRTAELLLFGGEVAHAEAHHRQRHIRLPLRSGDAPIGTLAYLGPSCDDLQVLGDMKDHLVHGIVAQALARVWIPVFPRHRVVVSIALIEHHVLAAVGDFERRGLAFLERLRQHHAKLRIVLLLFLHPVQRIALPSLRAAHSQRRIEIQRNHRNALLLRAHLHSGHARKESALLDRHVEFFVHNPISRVVLVTAGRAVAILRRAMKRQWKRLAPVAPVQQPDLFRRNTGNTVGIEREHQVRVLFAVNRGQKKPARRRAQHILQDAQIVVLVKMHTRKTLKLLGASCIS